MCASIAAALLLACAPTPQDQAAALQAAYQEALAQTPSPIELTRQQTYWLEDLNTYSQDEADKAIQVQDRIDALKAQAARDRRVHGLKINNSSDLAGACVEIDLRGCSVDAGGFIKAGDGRVLHWQLQNGYTQEDGIQGRLVLLADGMAARSYLQPVAWATGGVSYEAPVVFMDGGENASTYVALPGRYMGTGNHNADLVYRWNADGSLTQIDNWAWTDQIDTMLPEGLEIWKGVDFDYQNMFARSALWQSDDGNCCPTGGEAYIGFEVKDEAIVVSDLTVHDRVLEVVAQEPADVLAFAGRAQMCLHWSGEEPYDADRQRQIEAMVSELQCSTLSADATALKAKYADNRGALGLIARSQIMADN